MLGKCLTSLGKDVYGLLAVAVRAELAASLCSVLSR
jgi:hypothetical protein